MWCRLSSVLCTGCPREDGILRREQGALGSPRRRRPFIKAGGRQTGEATEVAPSASASGA